MYMYFKKVKYFFHNDMIKQRGEVNKNTAIKPSLWVKTVYSTFH